MMSEIYSLTDPRFKLVHHMTQRFSEGPDSQELRILHTGYALEKHLKKNVDIYPHTLLGIHSDPSYGHMLSPIRGKIIDLGPRFIQVQKVEEQPDDPKVAPLSKEEIIEKFAVEDKCVAEENIRRLGLNLRNIGKPCETLIINGLNSEPGIMWAEPLLSVHIRTVLEGLEMQNLFAEPKKIILVIPTGERVKPIEGVRIEHVDPIYPISIPALLKKKIDPTLDPKKISVVSLHALWGIGRVVETGFPLTETVVTLSTPGHGGNYIIKEGTRVIDLLDHTNFPLEEGDTVILGGPLRGASIALAERGIPKHIRGVFVVPAGTVPELGGASSCSNCGACDRACPAHLSPSMISRYAEFHKYDKCKEWYADYCLDCGICGFVCSMRRPVLQYMRLANQQIRLAQNAINIEVTPEEVKEKTEAELTANAQINSAENADSNKS